MATNFAVPVNNVSTTLQSNYTSGSGTLALASGTGSRFPALTGSQFYRVTVIKSGVAYNPYVTSLQYSVYKATAISGDNLTVTATLDGTSDQNYSAGDVVEVRVTSGTIGDLHTAVNALEFLGTPASISGTTNLTSAAFGTTQVCSGSSAYTVTLPAPVANKFIGFRMDPTLTNLVTIAQHASETIDGAAFRVMWANEFAILGSDGTNWFKIAGKSIPMSATIYIGSGSTSCNSGASVFVPMNTVSFDNTSGLMTANTVANGYVNTPRVSTWDISILLTIAGSSGYTPSSSAPAFSAAKLLVNTTNAGSPSAAGANYYVPYFSGQINYPTAIFAGSWVSTAGGYFAASFTQSNLNGASAATTYTFSYGTQFNNISVVEIVSW
jgi:hypothetical protein